MNFVLDTHCFIYFLLNPSLLGENAAKAFKKKNALFKVPTIALLEIQYLIEIKRIEIKFSDIISVLNSQKNFDLLDFDQKILSYAIELKDNRDPFDRIILASAKSEKASLLSKDTWMAKHYNKVVW